MKAKSIIVRTHGGPEVLEYGEVAVPDPGPDEVRIRQHAIGPELHRRVRPHRALQQCAAARARFRRGGRRRREHGSGVKSFKAGDRVAYPQGPLGAYRGTAHDASGDGRQAPNQISFEQARR